MIGKNKRIMEAPPVLPLNLDSMKALLEENRVLHRKLEEEKVNLTNSIKEVQDDICLASALSRSNHVSKQLLQKIVSVSSSLDQPVLQPNLTFRYFGKDATIEEKKISEESKKSFEDIQTKVFECSKVMTDLAIEEQRLNAKRSGVLQEMAALRQRSDDLFSTRERLEQEIEDLKALLEFWQQRNQNAKSMLDSSFKQITSLRAAKDAEMKPLLEELSGIYQSLKEASQRLKTDKN